MMLVIPQARASSTLPDVPLGSFIPDQQSRSYGAYPTDIAKWFSVQWGINSAEQVGAVAYPYQFMFGNFYQNGQQVSQDVYFTVAINVSVSMTSDQWGSLPDGTTDLGAPNYDSLSLGSGNYPVEVSFIQGSTVLTTNLSTHLGSTQTVSTGSIANPNPVESGPFYLVFSVAYFNFEGAKIGYMPIYIGEGEFNAINAHVIGKPTSSVTAGINSQATLEWAFSGGVWNVSFIHYLDNNPADLSPSNIRTLAYYNFTYAGTGGTKNLTYNFSSSEPSGVYAWTVDESFKNLYGGVFLVYNNATSEQSGDSAPSVSVWIKPAVQNAKEVVGIKTSDAKSTTIYLQVSVWFSNDMYTVPSPSYENVLYYFVPYVVGNNQNLTLNFTNTFYGQLNVEVISHNTYGMWNNTYASSVVKSNIYNNGSGIVGPVGPSIWVIPIVSPLNIILFLLGAVVLVFSIRRSATIANVTRNAIARIRQGQVNVPATVSIPTHYIAAFVLLFLSAVNWAYIASILTTWGHLIP